MEKRLFCCDGQKQDSSGYMYVENTTIENNFLGSPGELPSWTQPHATLSEANEVAKTWRQ